MSRFTKFNTGLELGLRLYVLRPLTVRRNTLDWNEAHRALANYSPATVQTAVCYNQFYLTRADSISITNQYTNSIFGDIMTLSPYGVGIYWADMFNLPVPSTPIQVVSKSTQLGVITPISRVPQYNGSQLTLSTVNSKGVEVSRGREPIAGLLNATYTAAYRPSQGDGAFQSESNLLMNNMLDNTELSFYGEDDINVWVRGNIRINIRVSQSLIGQPTIRSLYVYVSPMSVIAPNGTEFWLFDRGTSHSYASAYGTYSGSYTFDEAIAGQSGSYQGTARTIELDRQVALELNRETPILQVALPAALSLSRYFYNGVQNIVASRYRINLFGSRLRVYKDDTLIGEVFDTRLKSPHSRKSYGCISLLGIATASNISVSGLTNGDVDHFVDNFDRLGNRNLQISDRYYDSLAPFTVVTSGRIVVSNGMGYPYADYRHPVDIETAKVVFNMTGNECSVHLNLQSFQAICFSNSLIIVVNNVTVYSVPIDINQVPNETTRVYQPAREYTLSATYKGNNSWHILVNGQVYITWTAPAARQVYYQAGSYLAPSAVTLKSFQCFGGSSPLLGT